jgi:putative hydrolase of the HAD superfamily
MKQTPHSEDVLADHEIPTALERADDAARETGTSTLHPLLRGARAVLFDAGGTLVHPDWERFARIAHEVAARTITNDDIRRALATALYKADTHLRGGNAPTEEMKRAGWVFRRMYAMLDFSEAEIEELHRRIDAEHAFRHMWCGLDADAPRVIAELKAAGLPVGVISNTEDGRLVELLELVDLAAHFNFLIDSHVVGLRKPDAAIFNHALERLGLPASTVVYVGDSYGHDVLAARRAGLQAILVDAVDLYSDIEPARIRRLGELVGA